MSAAGEGMFGRLADRLGDQGPSGGAQPAFTMADLLELSDAERSVMRYVMRGANRVAVASLTADLAALVGDVEAAVAALVHRGALVVEGEVVAVAPIALNRRATPGGIWDRLSGL